MTKRQVRELQNALNHFTDKYLEDITPVLVDGVKGHATNKRIALVKYYLGYTLKRRKGTEARTAGHEFRSRMWAPRKRQLGQDSKAVARGIKRRTRQRKLAKQSKKITSNAIGFGTFEGKTVAAWMIPWLEKSRAAGWKGYVTSGVRTPDYSEHLCYAMCGRASCPGKCAGRSSNHNMLQSQGKPHGALDVTDYVNFGNIQKRIGSPLINRLGAQDPVHFSVAGN